MPITRRQLNALCFGATAALSVPIAISNAAGATPTSPEPSMIPKSHHGSWTGPNRLWVTDPENPFRSDGTIECTEDGIDYTWSKDDKEHHGSIRLHGQPAALRIAFKDTFHAGSEMALHGHVVDGVMRTFGTYGAGPGQPEWGWIIELDWRDPEALVLRMFNVMPKVGSVPAVVLSGTRSS